MNTDVIFYEVIECRRAWFMISGHETGEGEFLGDFQP
jgi:hypothetical protein